jgi:simple sugar transport system substrate-binding protein
MAALAAGASTGWRPAFSAESKPKMVVVHKIIGIPAITSMAKGVVKAGQDLGIDASLTGPTAIDPAQQIKIVEDLIAQNVTVIGLVPLDVAVCAPTLKKAHEAGIKVVTLEGANQDGRDWNVDMVDEHTFGEAQMKALAREMHEEGDYVMFVGTLTTPLHNRWADYAAAYQKQHYPKMRQAADRFPGADEIDVSQKTVLDVLKGYPNVRGLILFGANGPIGAGNALRQARLQKKVALVGTVLPSQGRSLIKDGIIREGFFWNVIDSGYAMVSVAKVMLDGKPINSDTDFPGMGKAHVDIPGRSIVFNNLLEIKADNIDQLVAQGL